MGESVADPAKYYSNNLSGGLSLLETAIEAGVGRFVFSSTAGVYGEPQSVPITESAPTIPINPYGQTKRDFEVALEYCHRAYGLSYVALRYFNAAGAHGDGTIGEDHRPESHLIPRILRAAMEGKLVSIFGTDYPTHDGTCVRDYVHVMDLGGAHVLALEAMAGDGVGGVFNLGNGEGFSVREVIAMAVEVTGIDIAVEEGPRRPGDSPSLVASSEKARKLLGWKPDSADIRTIIRSAWNWHSGHPDGYDD
jgi:UDP-glucose 4-epimerase